MSMPGTQTLRFRRPNPQPTNVDVKPARHTGILQDQLRRAQRRPWNPSFSLTIRILMLVRFSGAMYSNISDCDEVFNFWEPLHFLDRGYGFQTWEVSPQFAIRSWAYISSLYMPARLGDIIVRNDKRAAFFAVRIALCALSTFAEATLIRAVTTKINERVGRYLFFMLLFSAGMWNSATAFLPSSFAMYTTTYAFSYALSPASLGNNRRTILATLLFALGAIVGWPFALALAIPFVVEELFVYSGDHVLPATKNSWMMKRWVRLFKAGLLATLIFIPVIGLDSLAYGRLEIVPWNIVHYNIFGGPGRGPNLYGTEPWHYYLKNLVLNFNILVVLALMSLPALGITYRVDRKRLGLAKPAPETSSPFTILGFRLAPFYIWLSILSMQPHKEERFMFPAYTLLCFNAAVTIYLMRGWLETAYVSVTKSPYQASRSLLFRNFTLSIVVGSMFISVTRILALWHYYHSPMTIVHSFQVEELPRLLNASGLLPKIAPGTPEDEIPPIDLFLITQFNLTLCYGKEWYRFPGHYLIPTGVRVEFIKSEFDGLLPRHFTESPSKDKHASKWWLRPETRYVPGDLNDLNREDLSHYVPVETCDYLVDLDFPLDPNPPALEPRYIDDEKTWDRLICKPFLDAKHSLPLTRMFWLPGQNWQRHNQFGDYCLLKNKARVSAKERDVSRVQRIEK